MTDSEQNFARYTQSYWDRHPEEHANIVQEHLACIQQGVDVWNAFDKAFANYLKKNNNKHGLYAFAGAALSDVDFSHATFGARADFTGATFNGDANFWNATFSGDANFRDATFSGSANFRDATFGGNAYFIDAKFSDDANFWKATFSGDANFWKATFSGEANFRRAIFSGKAGFIEATFSGNANFYKATFGGNANFSDAIFSGEADFYDATFGGYANFWKATFSGEAYFNNATFKSRCSFYQAKSKKNVPNFIGAQYKIAPLIEGFKIPWVKDRPEINIEAYRQLKKFAIEGANHEQEIRFFAFETRCKLYLESTPKSTKALIGLYSFFSDFGQSIVRPLGCIFLTWALAFGSTLLTVKPLCPCQQNEWGNAFESQWAAALSQSISFTVPILATDRGTRRQRNQCLYGHDGIPWQNRLINGMQRLFTLVFLFLFGLAVRNRFKIK